MPFWLNANGKICVTAEGKPILCATSPCEETVDTDCCTGVPTTLYAHLTYNNPPCECDTTPVALVWNGMSQWQSAPNICGSFGGPNGIGFGCVNTGTPRWHIDTEAHPSSPADSSSCGPLVATFTGVAFPATDCSATIVVTESATPP